MRPMNLETRGHARTRWMIVTRHCLFGPDVLGSAGKNLRLQLENTKKGLLLQISCVFQWEGVESPRASYTQAWFLTIPWLTSLDK